MKKIYNSPEMQSMCVETAPILAGIDSVSFDSNETVENNDDIGVKAERTLPSNYNVWDDDWSK